MLVRLLFVAIRTRHDRSVCVLFDSSTDATGVVSHLGGSFFHNDFSTTTARRSGGAVWRIAREGSCCGAGGDVEEQRQRNDEVIFDGSKVPSQQSAIEILAGETGVGAEVGQAATNG